VRHGRTETWLGEDSKHTEGRKRASNSHAP
jgi:hypothetical protein